MPALFFVYPVLQFHAQLAEVFPVALVYEEFAGLLEQAVHVVALPVLYVVDEHIEQDGLVTPSDP